MTDAENQQPKRVKFNRIVPQIKTYRKGTLLRAKIDLYYSLEEDIVEVGGGDGAAGPLGSTSHSSFPQTGNFICKDSTILFVEAAQFRASDGNVYIRAQILSADKIAWINLVRVPNRVWAFKIRSEQKKIIQDELEKTFELLADDTTTNL